MKREWKLKEPIIPYAENESALGKLQKIYGIEDLKDFLAPSKSHIISPYNLKNIEQMTERIIKAINKNEKIVIYLDVDFDGVVSGIILYKYLLNFTNNVEIIYVQRSEGHGTKYVLDQIPKDTDLYIAVDSSTNDVKEIKYLHEMGIECLIIDHHQQTEPNPYALIVNPQQEGCTYANKNACGGLIVYKVCQVIDDYQNTSFAEQFADLPGFALAADMMKMDKNNMENRYYFHYSLTNLKHVGLRELFTQMGAKLNNLRGTDFSFGVSPAISAATRLDKIEVAIELLSCVNPQENTYDLAKQLVGLNEERKKLEAETFARLKEEVDFSDRVLIFYDPTIGKGIRGLAAQQLMQTFKRPVIVLGDGETVGEYSGSYRSPENINFMDALNKCTHALYGAGHPPAGGTATREMGLLRDELNEMFSDLFLDDRFYYDLEFNEKEITETLISEINSFYRVTGNGFSEGKLLIKGLFPVDKALMGKLRNTVKVDCGKLKLMKFKTSERFYNDFPIWSDIEVVGTLNINLYERFNRTTKKKELEKTIQVFVDSYKEV